MSAKMKKGVFVSLIVCVICCAWVLQSAAEPPALARLSGAEKARVAKLIEGAKKEGELNGCACSFHPAIQAKLLPLFRKEYGLSESDLKIKIASMRADSVITRVTEELKAKVYRNDIVNNGAVGWFNDLVARGELMAYDSPQYKYLAPIATDPKIGAVNPPYFCAYTVAPLAMVYNPKYVKGEINHWNDVLRPEYKGKIVLGDVSRSSTYTDGYIGIKKAVGLDFFKKLAKQDPFVIVSAVDMLGKVTTGEYPICVIATLGHTWRANLKGAGLKIVLPTEGVGPVAYHFAILTHAPHPNAAKLLVDFIYGEVAQKAFLETQGHCVTRMGLKAPDPVYPRPINEIEGIYKMDWRKISNEDRLKAREEFRRIIIEKK